MKDETIEAIKFITSLRTSSTGIVGYQLSAKQVNARNIMLNKIAFMVDRLERLEKLCEALVERYGYAYIHKLVDKSVAEVSQVREIMARLRVEFFGSRPKNRKEKINDILDMVEEARCGGRTSATDISNALESLRDEEEDV